MKTLLALLLWLYAGLAAAQNIVTASDPSLWGDNSCVTITSGISDPVGGTAAYRITASSTASCRARNLQASGFTTRQWVRASMWIRAVSGNSAGLSLYIYNGDSLGRSTYVSSAVDTTWRRVRADQWGTTATSGYYGILLSGATSGDAVEVYGVDVRAENTWQKHILVIGDSYTTHPFHFPQYMELGSSLNVWSKGIGGQTCAQVNARFTGDALRGIPRVVIHCGINDVVQDVAAATTMVAVDAMLTKAAAAGVTVTLVTPSPFSGSTSWSSGRQTVFNTLTTLMLSRDNGASVRVYNGSVDSCSDGASPPALTAACDGSDHLHRSAYGYGVLARGVLGL